MREINGKTHETGQGHREDTERRARLKRKMQSRCGQQEHGQENDNRRKLKATRDT